MGLVLKIGLCLIISFVFLSGFDLTIKPFSIKLKEPLFGLGCMVTMCGVFIVMLSSYKKGVKDAIKDLTPRIEELHKKADAVVEQRAELEKIMRRKAGFPFGIPDDDDIFSNNKL